MKSLKLAACTAAFVLTLSGCAVSGGWKGAEAESSYDKELAAKRKAETLNNDDYYEVHKDGRIYAFTDEKLFRSWMQTGEIAYVATRIGHGPKGETVAMQLGKDETKNMTKAGFKSDSEKMYSGEMTGREKGFYGEIHREGRIWVFENGKDLHEFQKSGEVPCGITNVGAGPSGKTVVYAQNCKAASKGKPEVVMARFKQNYGLN